MRRIRLFAIVIVVALTLFAASACTPPLEIKADHIDMNIGDIVDVCDYVSGDFSMNVSDKNMLMQISDTVLYAQSAGDAIVTVVSGLTRYDISVHVGYLPEKLSVTCSSPLYTTVRGTVLRFHADLGKNSQKQGDITWTVNDKLCGMGETFSLTVDRYDKYAVKASYRDQVETLTAVCYRPFSPPRLEFAKVDSGYTFKAKYESADDFAPEVVWMVDDAEVGIYGDVFTLNEAGRHTVFAYVNGEPTDSQEVVVGGKVKLENVRIDFDSDYPNVYLRWDGADDAEYVVTVDGDEYGLDDSRMGEGSFNLSGLTDEAGGSVITLTASGVDYEPSYAELTVPNITEKQKEYLSKKYFNGNYYMTSDEEVSDIITYAIFFREAEKVSFSVYMGYETEFSAAELLSRAWIMTEQMGSYRIKAYGSSALGETPTFEINFLSDNEPKPSDNSLNTSYQSLLTPHFGEGTALDLDMPSGREVDTSDQLFYIVQKGFKPYPKAGSAAERIYLKAQNVLSNILDNTMDDEHKVRAIYEWIMWNTVYDYRTSSNLLSDAVADAAYYMEGVFDDGYAVCDGISKSVSLLCNMAGIKCLRVIGLAKQQTASRHAWNKVCLYGKWYNLDATWDDALITMGGITYEGALHGYYLKTDSQMTTHVPNFPSLYPESNTFYRYGDDPAVQYVYDSSSGELTEAIKKVSEKITYEVKVGDEKTTRDFYCLEVELSIKAKYHFALFTDEMSKAIGDALGRVPLHIMIVNQTLLIMVDKIQ